MAASPTSAAPDRPAATGAASAGAAPALSVRDLQVGYGS